MSTTEQTHYEVLGVSRTAPDEIIRAAHRTMAKRLHPDREGGSDEAFAAVNLAADILLDPAQRAAYDAELAAAEEAPVPEPEPAEPVEPASWGQEEDLDMSAVVVDDDPVSAPAPEPVTHAPTRYDRLPGWARMTVTLVPPVVLIGVPILMSAWGSLVAGVIAASLIGMAHARRTLVAGAGLLAVTGIATMATWSQALITVIATAWVAYVTTAILNAKGEG